MTFLCIDDDLEDLELLCEVITKIEPTFVCHVADDSKEGLDKLTDLRPDFIFLDINMPMMDGKQTLQAIRSNTEFASVPVCILSTTISETEKETLIRLGASYCLKKPTSYEGLCSSLKRIFSSNQII